MGLLESGWRFSMGWFSRYKRRRRRESRAQAVAVARAADLARISAAQTKDTEAHDNEEAHIISSPAGTEYTQNSKGVWCKNHPKVESDSAKVVWSGWAGYHHRHNGWHYPTLNANHIVPNPEYCELSGAHIIIKKAGYYQIDANIMQHKSGNGWRHLMIQHNDSGVVNNYFNHYASSWLEAIGHYATWFEVGDTIRFQLYISGSNPYCWHSHSYHSRAYLTYLGGTK